jgi:hypothetical protein
MASGNDFRIALAKETTYATRVPPTRFIVITGEGIAFTRNRAYSQSLGMGRWARPSVLTTRGGAGPINGEVPTTGFGYLLDALHGNVVAPVQVGGTAAYLQTHTLDTPPTKSYSIQKQLPPVLTNTLVPVDYTGAMFTGITINWNAAGLLTWSMPTDVNDETTGQTLVTYVAPTAWSPYSYQGGTVTIGGVAEANVLGDGSLTIGASVRTDAYALGTSGTKAKPVETEKPTASMTFTADFNDITNITRVVNNTSADVVLKFEGATIAGANKFFLEVTLADCVFESPSPTVEGPGPVQQGITITAASTTGDPPIIKYQSTDIAL